MISREEFRALKIGAFVFVDPGFKDIRAAYDPGINYYMEGIASQGDPIKVSGKSKYCVYADGWSWAPEWLWLQQPTFEPAPSFDELF